MKRIIVIGVVIVFLAGCAKFNQDLRNFSDDQVIIWQDSLETDKHLTENFYEIYRIVSDRIVGALGGSITGDDLQLIKDLNRIAEDEEAGEMTNLQIGETKKLLYQVSKSLALLPIIREIAPALLGYLGL